MYICARELFPAGPTRGNSPPAYAHARSHTPFPLTTTSPLSPSSSSSPSLLRHKDDDDNDERVAINLFLKESDCGDDDDEESEDDDEHDYKVDDESVRHNGVYREVDEESSI